MVAKKEKDIPRLRDKNREHDEVIRMLKKVKGKMEVHQVGHNSKAIETESGVKFIKLKETW